MLAGTRGGNAALAAGRNSPLVLTSVEVLDAAAGVPTDLIGPSTPLGRNFAGQRYECATGGPLTMSDSLDEIVLLTEHHLRARDRGSRDPGRHE